MSMIESFCTPMADPIAELKMKMEMPGKFTRTEKWLLASLILANGKIVPQKELLAFRGRSKDSRAISVMISRLRNRIKPVRILSVRGEGFFMYAEDLEKARKILEDEA